MPIYEYICRKGHHFERMQGFSDPPAKRCPKCRSSVQRLISLSAFHLKGSGWYSKDNGSKGPGAGDKTAGGDSERISSKDDKSAEQKATETKKDPGGKKESAGKKDPGGKKESAGKKKAAAE